MSRQNNYRTEKTTITLLAIVVILVAAIAMTKRLPAQTWTNSTINKKYEVSFRSMRKSFKFYVHAPTVSECYKQALKEMEKIEGKNWKMNKKAYRANIEETYTP